MLGMFSCSPHCLQQYSLSVVSNNRIHLYHAIVLSDVVSAFESNNIRCFLINVPKWQALGLREAR